VNHAESVTRLVRRGVRKPLRIVKRKLVKPRYRPGLPDTSWVTTAETPARPTPSTDVRLFAVLGTWLEADVVGATVLNAFTQGCERVFLIDNDSPDDTVAEALAAGAELARSYATDHYDESVRMTLMNQTVAEVSSGVHHTDGDEHLWWLWLDADEFPHGPGGLTLLEYIRSLDGRYRVVGSRFLNHIPDRRPFSIAGRHPLDFQPLCEDHAYPMCDRNHRKHPLQRWDAAGPAITCLPGFHMATSAEHPLTEPVVPIITHHFPYRSEDLTRARLDTLCARDLDGGPRARNDEAAEHIASRYRSLNAVYDRRWSAVENIMPDRPRFGIELAPWTQFVEPADTTVARWYEPEAVDERSLGGWPVLSDGAGPGRGTG
jgi:hypothetical protein